MTTLKIVGPAVLLGSLVLTGSSWLPHHGRAEEPKKADALLPGLPAEFTRLHSLIKPRADESQLEQVPWMATLWEARLKAAAEGKPIFIWVTGGTPGGC